VSKLANANIRSRVIRALRRAGFVDRAGGKHTIMQHPDGRFTVIPIAKRLNVHTLQAILKQCRLSEDEYLKLY
jgi:predicted RNA binding protein YcfA (HicA-like mRNA interferase family)